MLSATKFSLLLLMNTYGWTDGLPQHLSYLTVCWWWYLLVFYDICWFLGFLTMLYMMIIKEDFFRWHFVLKSNNKQRSSFFISGTPSLRVLAETPGAKNVLKQFNACFEEGKKASKPILPTFAKRNSLITGRRWFYHPNGRTDGRNRKCTDWTAYG